MRHGIAIIWVGLTLLFTSCGYKPISTLAKNKADVVHISVKTNWRYPQIDPDIYRFAEQALRHKLYVEISQDKSHADGLIEIETTKIDAIPIDYENGLVVKSRMRATTTFRYFFKHIDEKWRTKTMTSTYDFDSSQSAFLGVVADEVQAKTVAKAVGLNVDRFMAFLLASFIAQTP